MVQILPTKPQYDYITCGAPYPAMVAGFGSGKTEAAIKRSIIGKLKYPELNRGFYEPTYDLVRMIAFPRFEEALTELGINYRLYKSPLNYIEIEGMAGKIFFRSMDTPSRIIGYEHADCDVDELDTLKEADAEEVFRRIQSRNRQKKPDGMPNTIGVTTTPEGFKFVYKRWGRGDYTDDGYTIIKAPTRSNPHLPDNYIPDLKASYPAQLIDAYLDAKFVNLTSGTVYHCYDRDKHASAERVKDKERLYVGMDFNVTKMAATIYVQREGGRVWHAVDEIKNGYDTPEVIQTLKSRYPEHSITVYPDASGDNRKSVGASKTDISLLRSAGFSVRAKDSNPRVKERVLAVNAAFEKGRLRVNALACPTTADNLEQQVYNEQGEPDKRGGKDHQNDATGYPIIYEMAINRFVIQRISTL